MDSEHQEKLAEIHRITEENLPTAIKAVGPLSGRFPNQKEDLECSAMESCYMCVRTVILGSVTIKRSIGSLIRTAAVNAAIDYLRQSNVVNVHRDIYRRDPEASRIERGSFEVAKDLNEHVDYDDFQRYYELTDIELMVSRLLAAGFNQDEIAESMNCTRSYVTKKRISAQLKVHKKETVDDIS